MKTAYLIGLDLGQSEDYTALCVLERHKAGGDRPSYDVRHLQRFKLGTSYPDLVGRIGAMLRRLPLEAGSLYLVVDATGVGAPVMDLLRRANLGVKLIAVTITAGDRVRREGSHYRVPKRDLVFGAQVLLQAGRLRFAQLPETPILVEELLSLRVTIDPDTAHDSYACRRQGGHDDLVLALALACWYGENPLSGATSGWGEKWKELHTTLSA